MRSIAVSQSIIKFDSELVNNHRGKWKYNRARRGTGTHFSQLVRMLNSHDGSGGGLTSRSVFFAPIVLICIISVIIYHLSR